MTKDLVSIIMPCYNASNFIRQSIDSVLKQSFTDWELLVIDDVSSDDSCEIVASYATKDKRINLLRMDNNGGAANARNKGIGCANGRYIAFLDSDDIWLPNKLQRQIDFMADKQVALCYSAYRIIDEEGKEKSVYRLPKTKVDYTTLLSGSVIGNLTAVYDSHQLGKVYMHQVGHEDYVLWLEILKRIDYALGIDEILAEYRVQSTSLSGNKIRAAQWQWRIYRDIEKLGRLRSLYLFVQYAFKGFIKY